MVSVMNYLGIEFNFKNFSPPPILPPQYYSQIRSHSVRQTADSTTNAFCNTKSVHTVGGTNIKTSVTSVSIVKFSTKFQFCKALKISPP